MQPRQISTASPRIFASNSTTASSRYNSNNNEDVFYIPEIKIPSSRRVTGAPFSKLSGRQVMTSRNANESIRQEVENTKPMTARSHREHVRNRNNTNRQKQEKKRIGKISEDFMIKEFGMLNAWFENREPTWKRQGKSDKVGVVVL